MQAKLFYGVLIIFSIGVGIQTLFPVSLEAVVWVLFLGFVLALVWRKNSFAIFAPYLLLTSALFIALSLGLFRTEIASWQFGHSPLESRVGEKVELAGVVTSEPERREQTVQFFVQTESDKVLVSTDRLATVSYGEVIQVIGKLERPESFTTEFGRTFNYPGYLKAKGVEYRISFAEVEVAGSGAGNPIISTLLDVKQTFLSYLQRAIPEPAASLGSGLLLGVRSALGDDIEDDFRRSGIIHIVVLSGYNVMLVVAFILFCLSYVLPLRWRLLTAVIAIVAFALVVGLSATVVRASVMASLVLLAQFLGRTYNVLRALLFAGAVMIVVNPYLLIYDIGFQLSFMATLGLVLLLPHFESTVIEKGKNLGVREFFLSTLATQIAVLPLLMYHIGQVSLIALAVNVLVLPVVPVAMLLTFCTGLLGYVSVSLGGLVGYVATLSLQYILAVASWFADLPLAAIEVPPFSSWGVFGLYMIMLLGWFGKERLLHRKGKDLLADWTIEIEVEPTTAATSLRRLDLLSDVATPAATKDDIPIFFR